MVMDGMDKMSLKSQRSHERIQLEPIILEKKCVHCNAPTHLIIDDDIKFKNP